MLAQKPPGYTYFSPGTTTLTAASSCDQHYGIPTLRKNTVKIGTEHLLAA